MEEELGADTLTLETIRGQISEGDKKNLICRVACKFSESDSFLFVVKAVIDGTWLCEQRNNRDWMGLRADESAIMPARGVLGQQNIGHGFIRPQDGVAKRYGLICTDLHATH